MNPSSDVVIVGGGVIGLALAYQLSRQNMSVTVLEKAQIGQEASSAAAGILAAQVDMDEANPLTELAISSRNGYPEFVRELTSETGIDVEFSKSGLIYVAISEEEERALQERHQWQIHSALPVKKLSGQEILRLENRLHDRLRSGLLFPEEAYVDNVNLVEALRVACARCKVRLMTGCHVDSLAGDAVKVTGVGSTLGFWPTGNVVIAAGSWSSLIDTHLPGPPSIKPSRGQMIAVKTQSPFFTHIIYSSHVYFVPRKDGRLLLGSTVEWVGFEKSVTLGGVHQIISRAMAISPSIGVTFLVHCWSGLRPYYEEANGLPILGKTDLKGLYFATGHFRNGILLAPITAKLMTELIVTGSTPKLLAPFRPPRCHY